MLGRALIMRSRTKTRTAERPCAPIVACQRSFATGLRSSRDCFQIR